MSLIMDALKKAQQLRSREAKGAPFFRQDQRRREVNKKRWLISVGTVAGVFILSLTLWYLILVPTPPSPQQMAGIVVRESPLMEMAKITPEPLQANRGLTPLEKSKPSTFDAKKESEKQDIAEEPKPSTTKLLKEDAPSIEKESVEKQKREPTSTQPTPEAIGAKPAQKEEKPLAPEDATPKSTARVEVVVKDHPRTIEVIRLFNSGVTFYQQKEINKAIQAYERVIELDPSYVEAYNNLGMIYQEMGDFESAMQSYQKAVQIDPKYVKGFNNIGILLHLKGEDEKAIEAFHKALATSPTHIESLINLGTLYKKKGWSEKGAECYRKALSINPHHGETHYNLGLLYEQMGKTDLAIHHFQEFLHLSSGAYPELASRVRRYIQQLMRK